MTKKTLTAILLFFITLDQPPSFSSDGDDHLPPLLKIKYNKVKNFPLVGPIIRDVTPTSITIMGQGDSHLSLSLLSSKKAKEAWGVLRYRLKDHDSGEEWSLPHHNLLSQNHLDVVHFTLSDLTPQTSYLIQVGYAVIKPSRSEFDWSQAVAIDVKTLPLEPQETFHFFTGSCRYLPHILGHAVKPEKGDRIFKSMIDYKEQQTEPVDFFAAIGDQIYADATGPIGAARTEKEYEGYYQRAFSQPFIRALMEKLPIYMMRDDHEWWNDATAEVDAAYFRQNLAARLAYNLFERPFGLETPTHWYTISNGIDAFFTDTRSERLPSKNQLMSEHQLSDLKGWLLAPERQDRIKIVFTSVPILLLQTQDSWGGFAEQQTDLFNHIVENKISSVVFISGDAHCENDGMFRIYDKNGEDTNQFVTEILVSGLYSISRGKAGKLTGEIDLTAHDNGYRFSCIGGLKRTLTENLFGAISGNHREKTLNLKVITYDTVILKDITYNLTDGTITSVVMPE